MKAFLIVSFVVMLSACATTDKAGIASATPSPKYQASASDPSTVDWRYVERVERIAASRGVQVKWVQPPRVKDRRGHPPR